MAKTCHRIRSSSCARCHRSGTRRCVCGAFYCNHRCQADDASQHAGACAVVRGALETAQCRTPDSQEAAALQNFVTVVDFQLSLPPLEDDGAVGATTCSPPQASGNCASASEFLGQRTEGVEAVVDWLVLQAPCLLNRPAADLLLASALRLRNEMQDAEVHLIAWAILDRCLTAGVQQFQDALMLQHSSFSDWAAQPAAEGQSQSSPRQLAGLDLVRPTADAVLAMLAPVSALEFADQNPFLLSPLELPPPLALSPL